MTGTKYKTLYECDKELEDLHKEAFRIRVKIRELAKQRESIILAKWKY